jgi:hypothetical protein
MKISRKFMLIALAIALTALPCAALAAPVAQGGVIFIDGIPQAFAVVFDGEEMISDAQVSINGVGMSSDGDGLYSLDLRGYNAGDLLVFTAKDATGKLIYTSSGVVPAEVNMASANPPTTAGAEYTMEWSGGGDAKAFCADYADLANGLVYSDNLAPGTSTMMVPAGITYAGDAIFAASAISGDTKFLNLTMTELMKRSYFLINRSAWIEADLAQ